MVSALLVLSRINDVAAAKMIVTLGDSFSAGTGSHPLIFGYDDLFGARETLDGIEYEFSPLLGCGREIDTTPGARLAERFNNDAHTTEPVEAEMIACGGAVISNLYDQIDYANAKYPEQQANYWKDSIFLMTIALNSLRSNAGEGTSAVRNKCIFNFLGGDNCMTDENRVGNREEIKADMMETFTFMATEASRATIRVFGYGLPYQRDSDGVGCSAFGTSSGEADFIDNEWYGFVNDISKEVIDEIKANMAPQEIDFEFIDVTPFITVAACSSDTDEREMNGFGSLPPGAFHPSPKGYERYYAALLDNLQLSD